VSGSEVLGPIDASTTFSLTCTGSGGSAVQMVAVDSESEVNVSWVAPTENVDGTALTDLAGYRIYYGPGSRDYDGMLEVNDPTATSHSFTATSGDWYITMTALDRDGNESAFSNEIVRAAP
jgi:hypothetical protein